FDEIVREDFSRERPVTGQPPECAMANERGHTEDRVVSPIMRLTELPEMHAGGEERAVNAIGKLLNARVERVAAACAWCGLNDAGVWIRLHQPYEFRQAFAAHDAVSIHDDHVAVIAAPAAAEVSDVAALAVDAAFA